MNKREGKRLIFLKKNRRGSHVGMMLSFLIFVTFLAFLYSVFRPTIKLGEDKSLISQSVGIKIIENTSAELVTATIRVNTTKASNRNCISLNLFFTLMQEVMPLQTTGATVIVKNSSDKIQPSYNNVITNPFDTNLKIDRTNKKDNFFRVYYSLKFGKLGGDITKDCLLLDNRETPPNYIIGTVTSSKYIFEQEILRLKQDYIADYENLKKNFNIPQRNEFWFNFTKSDGTSIYPQKEISESIDIFSEEIPVQYFNSFANIQSGFINIKVW